MTKAKQVRELIAKAKAKNTDAEALIAKVVATFGFTRQLARTYIKSNWDKVEAEGVDAKLAEKRARDAARKREKRAAAKAAAVENAAEAAVS